MTTSGTNHSRAAPPSAKSPELSFARSGGSLRRVLVLGTVLPLLWLPAILGRPIVAEVASLHALGQSSHPYFQPQYAGLLYFVLPAVILSGFVLLLSPGVLIVLAMGQGAPLCEFVDRKSVV